MRTSEEPRTREIDDDPPSLRPSVSIIPPAPRGETRIRPRRRAPARGLVSGFVAGLALFALFAIFSRTTTPLFTLSRGFDVSSLLAPFAQPAAAETSPPAIVEQPALQRDGKSPVAGGLLVVLPKFQSSDGKFDLIVHFHGNTELVIESYATVDLNAALVVMNLGVNSGPYERRFSNAAALAEVLDRARAMMEKRGLANASIRRLALSAWSGGYGAVERIIEQPALAEKVDSVILLDGIHVGFLPKSNKLDLARLEPFARFARQAADGTKLMSITHSDIDPMFYAGTHATTDALLKDVSVERTPSTVVPAWPSLVSMEGVVAKKSLRPLKPASEARKGGLVVRGYKGDQPEDHLSHLMQMSTTALPDLVERWKTN